MKKIIFSCLFFLFAQNVFSQAVTRYYTVVLRSNSGLFDTLWDGQEMRIYGFSNSLSTFPTLPAQTLYANEGDTVHVHAYAISQGEHHTIHLHGLDVNTQNDGDPSTSFFLAHGEDTTYTFIAQHAGTYLYHCHVSDVTHVQLGMYGLVVVKAANGANTAWTGGPAFNKYYNWITSEVDKGWHDTIPFHDIQMDTTHIPPYHPNYFLVNGKSHQQQWGNDSTFISGAQNDHIYLRIGNIGFFNNIVIFPSFLHALIIDSDGRPLPSSFSSDTLNIAPGERYGVMLNPDTQLSDSITIQYASMNTGVVWGIERVPVKIQFYTGNHGEVDVSPHLLLYPNPAADKIYILNAVVGNFEVNVFDMNGRNMLSQKNNPEINLEKFAAGNYLVQLKTKSGILESKIQKM